MADSWNKKEREKKKQREKQDKAEKMKDRKENAGEKKGLDAMLAYVDENGNIIDQPPDPRKRTEVNVKDIVIGVPPVVQPSEEELTRKGKITFFNHEKGFGFIKDQQSQESIFVHANNLSGNFNENDKVSFQTEKGPRGLYAFNVKLLT
ncbi:MAG TPA: cold shock domain-containing protein [Chitinophagaceae bacterium]